MEEEISLFDLMKIIFKNKLIVIISLILGGIMALCYCFFLAENQYQSTAKILLTKSKENESAEYNYNNSLVLIKTVSELPKQSIILEKVAEKYQISVENLMQKITVNNPQSSLVIEITCTTKDKNQSCLLANAVVDTLIEECSNNKELVMIGNSLLKTSTAQIGTPIKNNKFLIGIAILFFFGVFGIVIIFIKYGHQKRKEVSIAQVANLTAQFDKQ